MLDVREAHAFAAGHRPGAVNVPVSGSAFGTKSAFVLPERPIVIDAADEAEARRRGAAPRGGRDLRLLGWREGGGSEQVEPVTIEELERQARGRRDPAARRARGGRARRGLHPRQPPSPLPHGAPGRGERPLRRAADRHDLRERPARGDRGERARTRRVSTRGRCSTAASPSGRLAAARRRRSAAAARTNSRRRASASACSIDARRADRAVEHERLLQLHVRLCAPARRRRAALRRADAPPLPLPDRRSAHRSRRLDGVPVADELRGPHAAGLGESSPAQLEPLLGAAGADERRRQCRARAGARLPIARIDGQNSSLDELRRVVAIPEQHVDMRSREQVGALAWTSAVAAPMRARRRRPRELRRRRLALRLI